jgi:hypothetical protein
MQPPVDAPTPQALADLVARCDEIERFATTLAAAEELRIAALASGIVVMRKVLALKPVPADKLPLRQARIAHWVLNGPQLADVSTPAIARIDGLLVLDEHAQVKILSRRSWRGAWRQVTLWRDGACGLSAAELMEYLAALSAQAQKQAPQVARSLLQRSQALAATAALAPATARGTAD